jgi:uncharacterized repeat protein (TIGR03843 family)
VSAHELTADAQLHVLRYGRAEVLGRLPWSSNATLLAEVHPDESATSDSDASGGAHPRPRADARPQNHPGSLSAVYKPRRGERRLWDFPPGLDRREVAAYELSVTLGWPIVPETVLRDDLPLGVGSLQRFVRFDPEEHYFSLYDDPAHHRVLRTICCFDLVSNQADRKGGHCLLGEDGRIWAVDNALAFHRDLKLRTVIWEFAGQPVPDPLLDDLCRLVEAGPPRSLDGLLAEDEQAALIQRARNVVQAGVFPNDPTGHRYPWPPV